VVVYLLVEVGFIVGSGLHQGGRQDLILKQQIPLRFKKERKKERK
jgi:hypothetical protein